MDERKGRAPNLYIYRAKNKDRNHTINSCEMLQTSDKSTKKPQLHVRFSLLNRRGSPGPAKRFSKFNWAATRFSTQVPLHALFISVLIGLCCYNNVLAIWGHSRWKLTLTEIVSLRAFLLFSPPF